MNKTIDNHKTGQRILSLLLITISISTILLSASWMKARAISANDITVTAPQSGYYYPGLTLSCMITVTGATNNTTASLYYPYYTYGSNPQKLITGLSHIGQYNYSGTTQLSSSDWVPGRKLPHSPWAFRQFSINVTDNGVLTKKMTGGYITVEAPLYYSLNDSTFYYTNYSSNSFQGVATPTLNMDSITYNCLAYAVGITTNWEWPWGSNPTKTQLDDYMAKTGSYSGRNGSIYTPCSSPVGSKVIYYSNYSWGKGTDGHFAKVVAWDSNGYPSIIYSKWGYWELIKSTSYNPFNLGNGGYGQAKAYYQ